MACIGCKSNCLDFVTDECIETTFSVPDLGIEVGDSLKSVLTKTAGQVAKNAAAIADCSFCGGDGPPNGFTTEVGDLGFTPQATNTCLGQLPKNFKLNVVPTETTVDVIYNFNSICQSLPEGYTVLQEDYKVRGKADNYDRVLYQSKSSAAGITLEPRNLPGVFSANIRVNSPCGEITLSRDIPLNSDSVADGTFTANEESFVGTVPVSQADANKYFETRLNAIESTTNAATGNITLAGCPEIPLVGKSTIEVIQAMYNKICDLQKQITELKDVTIPEEFQKNNCCEDVTAQLSVQAEIIRNNTNAINNIPVITTQTTFPGSTTTSTNT